MHRRERVDEFQPGGGTVRHPDGDGTVQLDDRRRCQLRERVVERDDALPVGLRDGARAHVAGRDRRL